LSVAILHANDILLFIGRILLTFKQKDADTDLNVAIAEKAGEKSNDEVKSQLSHFLPTSRRIMQFSNGQVSALKVKKSLGIITITYLWFFTKNGGHIYPQISIKETRITFSDLNSINLLGHLQKVAWYSILS
jgi:hypothetical protein